MNKKIRLRYLVYLIIVIIYHLVCPPWTQAGEVSKGVKVVGYIPDYEFERLATTLDFSTMSDLNYFSLIPQEDGSLIFSDSGSPTKLRTLVSQSHRAHVKVGASIGGWGHSKSFEQATDNLTRPRFIKELVHLVKEYDLDTLDIDWEYPSPAYRDRFEIFITELVEALDGKAALSICVPTGVASDGQTFSDWSQHFSAKALNEADWINIMAYDGELDKVAHHSPSKLTADNLTYWNELMGGKAMDKLVSGIPFYGKAEDGQVLTYAQLSREVPGCLTTDNVVVGEVTYYFNSKLTINEKVQDTLDLGGLGVMIWTPTFDNPLNLGSRLIDGVTYTLEENNLKVERESSEINDSHEVKKRWRRLGLSVVLYVSLIGFYYSPLGIFLAPKQFKGSLVNRRKFSRGIAKVLFLSLLVWGLVTFIRLKGY